MVVNPFTPTFGKVPVVLAGRDRLLSEMQSAFVSGPGDPNLSSLLVGARGTGKTALLTRIRDIACECGWVAVGTSAIPGMLEDIIEQAVMAGNHLVDPAPKRRLTSVTAGPFSASWDYTDASTGNWRTRMGALLDQLAEHDAGLLITVDEVRSSVEELVTLTSVYQHFVSEDRRVALAMAGLPYHVDQLVSNDAVSFLRRSKQHDLARIADADVRSALVRTVETSGGDIDDVALDACIPAIKGFPYMLQLVGYRAWIESGEDHRIAAAHAARAIWGAQEDMERDIIGATVRELSDGDMRFLRAMLEDEKVSRVGELAKRMGVSSGYASKDKSRLLVQGAIDEVGRGRVAFAIPGLREYLLRR